MPNMRAIFSLLLAATVPGTVAFALMRYVITPPTQYEVRPPERIANADVKKTIHRLSQSAESAMPIGAESGFGRRGFTSTVGGGRGSGSTEGTLPGPGNWTRSGSAGGERPSGAGSGRPSTGGGNSSSTPTAPAGTSSSERPATFTLTRLFTNIGRLEETPAPLTPAQAKDILTIMKPLRTQGTLTPDQAGKVLAKLEGLLTANQKTVIAEFAPQRTGGGPSRAGGDNPGGGRPPQGSGGFGGDMDNMNPFNPNTDNPMAQRMAERNAAIFDALEARASQ